MNKFEDGLNPETPNENPKTDQDENKEWICASCQEGFPFLLSHLTESVLCQKRYGPNGYKNMLEEETNSERMKRLKYEKESQRKKVIICKIGCLTSK